MIATKDPLVASIEQLEAALAADALRNETAWIERVREALRAVESALGRHPAPSAKAVSSHVELQRREISPTIVRGTDTLRKEQQAMLDEVDLLVAQLGADPTRPLDVAALRQHGERLTKSLRDFCKAENKLVFDNVMGDTGAGD